MNNTDDLVEALWNACNPFRGELDASEYLRHILALLFIKFISGLEAAHDLGTNKNWPKAWSLLKKPHGCDWSSLQLLTDGEHISFRLDDCIARLEQANPGTLKGVFQNVQFQRLTSAPVRHTILNSVVTKLSHIDLHPMYLEPTRLGEALERFIELLQDRSVRTAEEFFVPSTIADLLAHLLAPQPGQTILDPACGSGLLLSRLSKYGDKNKKVAGQDWRSSAWSTCKINLLLSGVVNTNIHLRDPLRDPLRDDSGQLLKADIVVSNPPFGLRDWSGEELWGTRPELFRRGVSPRGRADSAFISHMLEVARPMTGRVGVIVSLGILFRQDERELRRSFIEDNVLQAVVSLPPKLFHKTNIPVAVLLFDKSKRHDEVVFIDASHEFDVVGRLHQFPATAIEQVVQAARSNASVPGFSYRATPEEIRSKDFELSVPLYVRKLVENDSAAESTEALHQRIQELESELSEVRAEIDQELEKLGFNFG